VHSIHRLTAIAALPLVLALTAAPLVADPPPVALKSTDFGKGPSLVLVTGLGGVRTEWMPTARKLLANYRVVMVDIPGHGESPMPDPFSLDIAAAELDQVLVKLNPDSTIVVGHGLGGLLAILAMKQHPEHMRGVVAIDAALRSPMEMPDQQKKYFLDYIDESSDNYNAFAAQMFKSLGRDSAQAVEIHSRAMLVPPVNIKAYLRELLYVDASAAVKDPKVPILFVSSSRAWPDTVVGDDREDPRLRRGTPRRDRHAPRGEQRLPHHERPAGLARDDPRSVREERDRREEEVVERGAHGADDYRAAGHAPRGPHHESGPSILVAVTAVLILSGAIAGARLIGPPAVPAHYAFGRGPTIVMVHGLGSRIEHWLPVARRLARTHRVVLVELPGHGESEMPAPFSLDRVTEALDRELAAEDGGPVVLVGHSVGGLVAANLAIRDPARRACARAGGDGAEAIARRSRPARIEHGARSRLRGCRARRLPLVRTRLGARRGAVGPGRPARPCDGAELDRRGARHLSLGEGRDAHDAGARRVRGAELAARFELERGGRRPRLRGRAAARGGAPRRLRPLRDARLPGAIGRAHRALR
jgi:pimeloyl-ACP methyl ester carboxylesterase